MVLIYTKNKKLKMRNFSSNLILALFVILMFACNSNERKKATPTAIEMIAEVFEGNHSAELIKEKMDSVMSAYNIEITEENYHKCGSALLSLRKATVGVTELDIINHMLLSNTAKHNISFPDQAGLSASLLDQGNKK